MLNFLLNRIPDSYEIRSFSEDLRTDADLGTFTGHASAFGFVDSYGTTFDKRAFNKTLADKADRIPVVYFHDPMQVIGPVRTLKPDRVGLYHESKAVDDGGVGSYVLAHLRGGTPMGMSFGFTTRKARPAEDADDIRLETGPEGITREDVRVITEVELHELSVLPWTFASQPKADITSVRSVAYEDALSTLMHAVRAGSLDERHDALCREFVAAYRERAGAGLTTPLQQARRHRDVDIAVALAQAQWLPLAGVIT